MFDPQAVGSVFEYLPQHTLVCSRRRPLLTDVNDHIKCIARFVNFIFHGITMFFTFIICNAICLMASSTLHAVCAGFDCSCVCFIFSLVIEMSLRYDISSLRFEKMRPRVFYVSANFIIIFHLRLKICNLEL